MRRSSRIAITRSSGYWAAKRGSAGTTNWRPIAVGKVDPQDPAGRGPAGGQHALRLLDVREDAANVIEVGSAVVSKR